MKHTLNEVAEIYKESALRYLHESTVYLKFIYYRNHIEDIFGERDIQSITTLEIEKWINGKAKNGYLSRYKQNHHMYSYQTLNRLLSIISCLFDQAIELRWLDTNPATPVKRFRDLSYPDLKPKYRFYTYNQFKSYIKHAKNPKYKLIFEILFFMGLRSGELRALTWEDIDFENKSFFIRKTMNVDHTFDGKEKATLCKTKRSVRTIIIPDTIYKDLIKYQKKEMKRPGFSNEWYVFGDTKSLQPKYLYRNNLYIARRAKMERINIHGFRHSCVSYLMERGLPTIEVAAYIGDRRDVVEKVYAHVNPEFKQKIAKKINEDY